MLLLNNQIKAYLNITPTEETPSFCDLGKAFKSITQTLGENVYTASYLSGDGFSSSEVTGFNFAVTLTGDYMKNDPVIEYIFSPDVLYGVGEARKTQLKLSKGNTDILWEVTLVKIAETGGAANQPNGVTLEIKGNKKPTVINRAEANG